MEFLLADCVYLNSWMRVLVVFRLLQLTLAVCVCWHFNHTKEKCPKKIKLNCFFSSFQKKSLEVLHQVPICRQTSFTVCKKHIM